jgi:hypothetical protein
MQTYDLTPVAVYCSHRHNTKEENFLEFFQTLGNKFIAGVISTVKTHFGVLV